MTDKKLFNTMEAAEYLKYSEATLELWRKEGRGPKFHQPARKVYYFVDDIEEWIKTGGDLSA